MKNKDSINLVFLGAHYTDLMEEEILRKTKKGMQTAANKLQWAILHGLNSLREVKLISYSLPFLAPYPNGSLFLTSPFRGFHEQDGIRTEFLPFVNIWGYRNISRFSSLCRVVQQSSAFLKTSCDVVIAYSCHTPILGAAIRAKEINPKLHICLIVPDLPEFMNLSENRSLAYKVLKEIDNTAQSKLIKKVDSFVLLTKQMVEALNVGNRPYCIVEGITPSWSFHTTRHDNSKTQENKRQITYTGTLNRQFGIMDLVEAFIGIDDTQLELIVCGSGEAEKDVIKAAALDKRIRFLGVLSADDTRKIQETASVLVNPRLGDGEYTKYSFPSKNLEYLLSGNPVVVHKLEGIPDEYDEFFIYAEGDDSDSLRKAIVKTLSMSSEEVTKRKSTVLDYLLNNKTEKAAARKIYSMISRTLSGE